MLVTPPQVSVAVATPVLSVVGATVHSSVMLVGQMMIGGTVSLKLIVCRQLALLPQPSVAVQVRRILALPVQLVRSKASRKVMLAMPLHASVAVADPVLLVVGSTVHSSTRSAGQVRTGGVVSLTVTSVVQRLEQLLLMTFRIKVKFVPQALPAVTLTVWRFVAPVSEPLPVIDHE